MANIWSDYVKASVLQTELWNRFFKWSQFFQKLQNKCRRFAHYYILFRTVNGFANVDLLLVRNYHQNFGNPIGNYWKTLNMWGIYLYCLNFYSSIDSISRNFVETNIRAVILMFSDLWQLCNYFVISTYSLIILT